MKTTIKGYNKKVIQEKRQFSGSIHVQKDSRTLLSDSFGYAIHSEELINHPHTKFSVASGSKIFTSVAICMLIEAGKLSFDTKINDCLTIDFPNFNKEITIHHLLTHTSGVPDYFDEDEMDDYEELWQSIPMYHMRHVQAFLPMFQNEKMIGDVGASFKYNNTGYIILGLIVEQISGVDFTSFVESHIFQKIGMNDSGYYSADALPKHTAVGYIENEDGTWKSNVFSLPVKGGPDGGCYVTAKDMGTFWEALMNRALLSNEMTQVLLAPQEEVAENIFYGYGGYMETNEAGVVKFIQMGYDPGVNFRAVHYPDQNLSIIVCSNQSEGAYEMLKEIEYLLFNN